MHFLEDIGISIIAATIIGVVTHKLKQPIILGYMLAGAVIGPEIGLKLVADPENIEVISEIGLILLLFIIGLEMDIKKVLSSGKQLLLAGIGQFILCVLIGLGLFMMLGYKFGGGSIDALYLSLFCALSSTAIVVKLLYDKFELDTLPGRITLGVLIFQDIWAILILAFQPNFTNPKMTLVGLAILKSIFLLAVGFIISRYVLKSVYGWIAKSPEMVVAVSIGWCASIAAIASSMNLSKEMGALIAGVSIATFPYSIHVTAKVISLRDFFLTLFFISLGMKIPMPELGMIVTAVIIVIFVIASRFMTVYPLLALSGSGRRTSFITSLNLAQISEFSLVIATLGVSYGHINKGIMSVVLYSMAITSVLSSYSIKFNHEIYLLFEKMCNYLGVKSKTASKVEATKEHKSYPIVILGFHRGARALVESLLASKPEMLEQILVIDFNPEFLAELKGMGIAGLFGDIGSLDTLKHAHIESSQIIISTIPDMLLKGTNNLKIVKTCRAIAPQATIIATADFSAQIEDLKMAGANKVILPYSLSGEYIANYLLKEVKIL